MSARPLRTPAMRFINGLAWAFIIFGAGALIYSALPSGDDDMLEVLTSMGGIDATMIDDVMAHMPASIRYSMDHPHVIGTITAFGSVLMLAAGLGLRKRREWGRIAAIATLVFVTAEHIVFAVLAVGAASALGSYVTQMDAEARHLVEPAVTAMNAMTALFTLLMCLLFAWMIWRLMSDAVCDLFRSVD